MALPDCFDCKYGGQERPCRNADGTFDFAGAGRALIVRGRIFGDDGGEPDPALLEATEWIADCEFDLVEDHPDLILPLVVAAMDACEMPEDAAYLAAGLIESALAKHGPRLIGGIEALAGKSAKVRYILSGIWSHGGAIDPDVWSRLGRAIAGSARMSDDGRSSHDGSPFVVLDEDQARALMAERVGAIAADLKLQQP